MKYVDPDGRFLYLSVSKSKGKMEVYFSPTGDIKKVQYYGSFDVVTNVCRNNRDNTKASDTSRYQENGTNPTQVKNGIYNISEARAPNVGNGTYGSGRDGLYIDVTQMLTVTSTDDKFSDISTDPMYKSTYGTEVRDTGYMIHITPYGNTNGCVGIKYDPKDNKSKERALQTVRMLVYMYDSAKKNGQTTQIEFKD